MGFTTFEEAFDYAGKQTNFDKKHGILIVDKRMIYDAGDIKLVATTATNGETGLIIFYRQSVAVESWSFWMPSKNQQYHLPYIAGLLRDIEHEKERRGA